MRVPADRVIRLNNVFQLSFGLLFWIPVFYVYQRQSGLSQAQIFGIQSIYYVAFCLLEIPTGLLADRFDYRRSMRWGAAILVLANVLPAVRADYPGFLAHFLLLALARSLVSGAGSAYLYDYLRQVGAEDRYRQAEGSARAYSLVGRVACLPVAGLLMLWQPASPYWLSALSAGIALVVAAMLPAIAGHLPAAKPAAMPLAQQLSGALGQFRSSRFLLVLMVQGVAVFTLVRIVQVNLFQPVLSDKATPLAWYGAIMAVTTLFEIAGATRSGWLRRLPGERVVVSALTVVMAAALAVLPVAGVAGTVAALCLFSLAGGLAFPLQRQLVNTAILDSSYRATLLSIESIIDRAVCALAALALGAYLTRGELDAFILHTALATTLVAALTAGAVALMTRTEREVERV